MYKRKSSRNVAYYEKKKEKKTKNEKERVKIRETVSGRKVKVNLLRDCECII